MNPFKLIRQKILGYTPEEVDKISKEGNIFYCDKFTNFIIRNEVVVRLAIKHKKNLLFNSTTAKNATPYFYEVLIMRIPSLYEFYGFSADAVGLAEFYGIKYFKREKNLSTDSGDKSKSN